jgi:hypothetical protein
VPITEFLGIILRISRVAVFIYFLVLYISGEGGGEKTFLKLSLVIMSFRR